MTSRFSLTSLVPTKLEHPRGSSLGDSNMVTSHVRLASVPYGKHGKGQKVADDGQIWQPHDQMKCFGHGLVCSLTFFQSNWISRYQPLVGPQMNSRVFIFKQMNCSKAFQQQ